MATAVLRSHDCLENRLHLDYFGSRPPPPMKPRKKHSRSPPPSTSRQGRPAAHRPPRSSPPKPQPTRFNAALSDGRKPTDPDKENAGVSKIRSRKGLVMEEVTILKRGEEFMPVALESAVDRRSNGGAESVLCSTNRLGPDPATLPKFTDLGSVYAGPAFISSPAPSCLPFPAFFLNRNGGEAVIKGVVGAKE